MLGSLAGNGSDLFTGGAQTGRVALRIDWTFLDRALVQARIDAAAQAVEQARDRYDQGFIGYFELLAAEQELTAMRDNLVRSQTAMGLAMMNVYRALAGGGQLRNQSPYEKVATYNLSTLSLAHGVLRRNFRDDLID